MLANDCQQDSNIVHIQYNLASSMVSASWRELTPYFQVRKYLRSAEQHQRTMVLALDLLHQAVAKDSLCGDCYALMGEIYKELAAMRSDSLKHHYTNLAEDMYEILRGLNYLNIMKKGVQYFKQRTDTSYISRFQGFFNKGRLPFINPRNISKKYCLS